MWARISGDCMSEDAAGGFARCVLGSALIVLCGRRSKRPRGHRQLGRYEREVHVPIGECLASQQEHLRDGQLPELGKCLVKCLERLCRRLHPSERDRSGTGKEGPSAVAAPGRCCLRAGHEKGVGIQRLVALGGRSIFEGDVRRSGGIDDSKHCGRGLYVVVSELELREVRERDGLLSALRTARGSAGGTSWARYADRQGLQGLADSDDISELLLTGANVGAVI